jgi:UDP-glucose 4-epimerase
VRVCVTGSSGHLGEALVRTLMGVGIDVVGIDILPSRCTGLIGSIVDREVVRAGVAGADAVLHAATLHKPQIATRGWRDFVDINVAGTLNLLEESVAAGVGGFVFTSTTSVFGRALTPPPGVPATWIDEDTAPIPRNIYGVTKKAAEDLVELFHHVHRLPAVILRTSRFFPEPDDDAAVRDNFPDANLKVNELLNRRVDIEDAAGAHLAALRALALIGFGRFVISATTPFQRGDLQELADDAPAVIRRLYPECGNIYRRLGWRLFDRIDRVYVNARARRQLGWSPKYDFGWALHRLGNDEDPWSELTTAVGAKGYQAAPAYPYTASC